MNKQNKLKGTKNKLMITTREQGGRRVKKGEKDQEVKIASHETNQRGVKHSTGSTVNDVITVRCQLGRSLMG